MRDTFSKNFVRLDDHYCLTSRDQYYMYMYDEYEFINKSNVGGTEIYICIATGKNGGGNKLDRILFVLQTVNSDYSF